MRTTPVIAFLGAVTLVAGCAHEQEHERASAESRYSEEFVTVEPTQVSSQKITRYADENRDGHVSRDEAKRDPALAAAFDRYDADDNDKLDRGEFARLEAEARERSAAQHQASRRHSQRQDDRWMSEGRPDGYFGPEPGESLNRTGVERQDSAD